MTPNTSAGVPGPQKYPKQWIFTAIVLGTLEVQVGIAWDASADPFLSAAAALAVGAPPHALGSQKHADPQMRDLLFGLVSCVSSWLNTGWRLDPGRPLDQRPLSVQQLNSFILELVWMLAVMGPVWLYLDQGPGNHISASKSLKEGSGPGWELMPAG